MAALNIAFEAPDNASGAGLSAGRPIDFDHLARQTMGDKALELVRDPERADAFSRAIRERSMELADKSRIFAREQAIYEQVMDEARRNRHVG